ncbi:N6-adenosine-specific RNA methylase IME4 [Rhizobium skierniewicense]|uniref:N6-adenosine-specific RNA methylase IME4 n=1 Tax=Rhizobium skierniewicense TaxID=984260 RepID=A0A7W6C673_9HYPH|nr:MT-A70 family methyltransferase [Rhizobium skierniewicense]MBB3944683.1 N6-adenosine-specific RNA methylase IME4 [Rhizobium skierniewicense]
MAAQTHPMLGANGLSIVAAAVRDGEFHCKSHNDRVSAASAMAHRYLTRDAKDSNLFRPGDNAADLLDRARTLGKLPDADAASLPERKVATVRDPQTVDAGNRLRNLDEGTVLALMESFKAYSQQQPIVVYGREADAVVRLGAGGHRLEASRRLGIKVLCFHADGDELDRQLCEIDENLIRADLTPSDKALFLARRKEIYLIKHPETAKGAAQANASNAAQGRGGQIVRDAKTFTAATAQATGQDERTIRRDVERGEKISVAAIQMLRGTVHDKGVTLDKLKRLETPEAQMVFARELIASDRAKKAETKEMRTAEQASNRESRMRMVNLIADHGRKSGYAMPRAAYPIGYADPPWQQEAWSDETGQDKGLKYPSMTVEAIKALCAGDKSPFTRDAVLLLWVTANRLPDGIAVLEAWGFEFVTSLVWDKVNIGMGRWTRDRHEILLIGKRGTISLAPLPGTQPQSVHAEPKTEHSRKPVWYAEQIDRLWPGMRKLELFQRKGSLAEGDIRLNGMWDFWGNQAGSPESEVA